MRLIRNRKVYTFPGRFISIYSKSLCHILHNIDSHWMWSIYLSRLTWRTSYSYQPSVVELFSLQHLSRTLSKSKYRERKKLEVMHFSSCLLCGCSQSRESWSCERKWLEHSQTGWEVFGLLCELTKHLSKTFNFLDCSFSSKVPMQYAYLVKSKSQWETFKTLVIDEVCWNTPYY